MLKITRQTESPSFGNVLGVDSSLTATGLVVLGSSGKMQHWDVLKAKKGVLGWARLYWQVAELAKVLAAWAPECVVFESYAMNQAHGMVGLVEIGTLLRHTCIQMGYPYFDAAPQHIKKFATGKGNAKKEEVMMGVLKQWQWEPHDNNVADAFTAAQIARNIRWPHRVALNQVQLGIVADVVAADPLQSIALGPTPG